MQSMESSHKHMVLNLPAAFSEFIRDMPHFSISDIIADIADIADWEIPSNTCYTNTYAMN